MVVFLIISPVTPKSLQSSLQGHKGLMYPTFELHLANYLKTEYIATFPEMGFMEYLSYKINDPREKDFIPKCIWKI